MSVVVSPRGSLPSSSRTVHLRQNRRNCACASARLIDGKAIASTIREEVRQRSLLLSSCSPRKPGLAVILVGSRPDSATYVRMKYKACEEAGIASFGVELPEDSTEEEVMAAVRAYNDDEEVDGILVQLPLPEHINEENVLAEVSVEKDVDGFHPLNFGKLAMQKREPLFVPCTPRGCIELLKRSGVPLSGSRAVVVGRSNVVGMPVALLLQRAGATVTVLHSSSPSPSSFTSTADILVAACGKAEMIKRDWIKPGAAVIDVGINAKEDATKKRGYRLVGDVDFAEAEEVAGWLTPVPGGVGPMTIAMLTLATVESAERRLGTKNL